MSFLRFLIILPLVMFLGCQQPPKSGEDVSNDLEAQEVLEAVETEEEEQNAFDPFYVYTNKGSRQNHFVPSGFMPDGNCISLDDKWLENCYSEKTCIKITYDVACSLQDQKWGGIYWLNPANNWGSRKGGYDLSGATKLTFWARGENGGEQIQEFTIGGISGNFPDSDVVTIGPVILSDEWRKYTIDLRGKDLSYISGGFSWTTNVEVNFDETVFYLDEIRYE